MVCEQLLHAGNRRGRGKRLHWFGSRWATCYHAPPPAYKWYKPALRVSARRGQIDYAIMSDTPAKPDAAPKPRPDLDALPDASILDACMLADRHRLRRRLREARKSAAQADHARTRADLTQAIARSVACRHARQANLPTPRYPGQLPVSERREEIMAAIREHQVVIVCGETGSGKTTQLPKMCLQLGRGVAGFIGHTQPRRIATRSVATRIAEELDTPLGAAVGYKIRFKDKTQATSYVKVMTDGILLAELQQDRWLNQYDTLIIDEAHERSLNIDFLLGYLKQLLPKRPDLKVIVTSATIDPERFAKHFSGAPIIEVSGRTYPVEVRYRPLFDAEEGGEDDGEQAGRDLNGGIIAAVDELARDGQGDVLVFLSGEREIREAAEALRKHHPPHTEILPLFARLSAEEQYRVFKPHIGRRIVLATNVAETSLTVPGIRYVVDTGLARISRYSYRSKVQRLPIEAISQASANQRQGRCGRVANGICIRLYTQEDFDSRPPFTDAEIQRTNLASVILQMHTLGLGDIEDFPFIDAPDPRYVKDGYRLLESLGALHGKRLSELGRKLARFPVDPRLARMILAAHEGNCLHEILLITSALSIQDPRERPMDKQQQADEARRRFADEQSDFVSLLNIWTFFQEQRHHLSTNKLRKLCRDNFISWLRMLEWQDIHSQLLGLSRELGLTVNSQPADYAAIHQAILSGLLANLGFKQEEGDYLGARNSRFHIFPGSDIAKKKPKWIACAQMLETTRVYGHYAASIDVSWVEPLAGHLIKRSYSEPHWEKRTARVAAYESVTLYGLPIVTRRSVNYAPIDPETSREIFIREALVARRYQTKAAFFRHNGERIDEIEELERKSRRRDILVDEETLFAFYDRLLPPSITSGASFEKWRKRAERKDPEILFIRDQDLMQQSAEHVTGERFPDSLTINAGTFQLAYHFEPGAADDGVSVLIPLPLLASLKPGDFEWLVPGLLEEKITQLIKTLPKSLRRNFVPAPDFAHACLAAIEPGQGDMLEILGQRLYRINGVQVPADAWRPRQLDAHLRMNYRVIDAKGNGLDEDRDLSALQTRLAKKGQDSFAGVRKPGIERDGLLDWDFGALPATIDLQVHGVSVKGYPALVDNGESVDLRILDGEDVAHHESHYGLRRLLMVRHAAELKRLRKQLPGLKQLCLHYATLGTCEDLGTEILEAGIDAAFIEGQAMPRDRTQFERLYNEGKTRLVDKLNQIAHALSDTLSEYTAIGKQLTGDFTRKYPAARDIREQLDHLIYGGFVAYLGYARILELPRYLKAIRVRLDKLAYAPERDNKHLARLQPYWQRYAQAVARGEDSHELENYHWLLEEFRVSLFAQEIKTKHRVSADRLEAAWREAQAQ